MSSPPPTSRSDDSGSASRGMTTARQQAGPKVPGGAAAAQRRNNRDARAKQEKDRAKPNSARAAGIEGGSSNTMLRLYTDDSPGFKVDPVIVLTLSMVFIFSVIALHLVAKYTPKL